MISDVSMSSRSNLLRVGVLVFFKENVYIRNGIFSLGVRGVSAQLLIAVVTILQLSTRTIVH